MHTRQGTFERLEAMRDRIQSALDHLGPRGARAERAKIRQAVVMLTKAVQERRNRIAVDLQRADKLLASLQSPWLAAGPGAVQVATALLSETNGRVWLPRLQQSGRQLFGIPPLLLRTALQVLEAEGFLRVHGPTQPKGGPVKSHLCWVEVLAATGGDGVPPPPDAHCHIDGEPHFQDRHAGGGGKAA
ncbi:MAG TPA: hypothetical protein VGG39_23490 [Polyangiaceae bacterium]